MALQPRYLRTLYKELRKPSVKKFKNNETIEVLGASFNGVKDMIEHAWKCIPKEIDEQAQPFAIKLPQYDDSEHPFLANAEVFYNSCLLAFNVWSNHELWLRGCDGFELAL